MTKPACSISSRIWSAVGKSFCCRASWRVWIRLTMVLSGKYCSVSNPIPNRLSTRAQSSRVSWCWSIYEKASAELRLLSTNEMISCDFLVCGVEFLFCKSFMNSIRTVGLLKLRPRLLICSNSAIWFFHLRRRILEDSRSESVKLRSDW